MNFYRYFLFLSTSREDHIVQLVGVSFKSVLIYRFLHQLFFLLELILADVGWFLLERFPLSMDFGDYIPVVSFKKTGR